MYIRVGNSLINLGRCLHIQTSPGDPRYIRFYMSTDKYISKGYDNPTIAAAEFERVATMLTASVAQSVLVTDSSSEEKRVVD